MRKIKPKKVFYKTLFILSLLLFLIFICIPIYWCLATSFKDQAEILTKEVTFWPKSFVWNNYVDAWVGSGFKIYFRNSFFVAVTGVVFIIFVSIVTGYALDRFKFKGKGLYMLILLCTQFIPGAMLLTPMVLLFKTLGLLNNLWGLVMINLTFRFPYDAILMRSFIHGIDYTLEEAAHIDGCNRLQGVVRILLPLLKPGIATVSAYAFISCWNEFLYSFMLISKREKMTLPVGLKSLIGEFTVKYGTLAAGAIIAVIPTLILFSYVQKHLVGGIAAGAVKG